MFAIYEKVLDTAYRSRQDGQAKRHGLDDRIRESFAVLGGETQQMRVPVQIILLLARYDTGKTAVLELQLIDKLASLSRVFTITSNNQTSVGPVALHQLQCLDCGKNSLGANQA